VPFAVTLHDLALVRHPELFPRWHRPLGPRRDRPVARAADRVFAVSEFTKREAVELLGVDEEHVVVVGNAIEPVFTPEGACRRGRLRCSRSRRWSRRKNLHRIARRLRRGAGVELRVVGAPGWGGVEYAGLGRRSPRTTSSAAL
jgi:hypothetical protein